MDSAVATCRWYLDAAENSRETQTPLQEAHVPEYHPQVSQVQGRNPAKDRSWAICIRGADKKDRR